MRIASLDGTIDEIVYNDRQFVPSGVLSPDGRFIATVGDAYMVEDQYPKILILELPRPVPEFDSLLPLAAVPMLILGTIVATRLKAGLGESNRPD